MTPILGAAVAAHILIAVSLPAGTVSAVIKYVTFSLVVGVALAWVYVVLRDLNAAARR